MNDMKRIVILCITALAWQACAANENAGADADNDVRLFVTDGAQHDRCCDAAVVDDASRRDVIYDDASDRDLIVADVTLGNDSNNFDVQLSDLAVDVEHLDLNNNDAANAALDASADAAVQDVRAADVPIGDVVRADVLIVDAHTDGRGNDAASAGDATLEWPFDTDLPTPCVATPVDMSGSAWTGWGSYQWPTPVLDEAGASTVAVDSLTGLVYGQVYQSGATEADGQAAGFSAELAYGPYGTLPTTDGRCWSYQSASYNEACDKPPHSCGNNDEYKAQFRPNKAGLYGLFFRYRPAGGQWLYGDRGTGSSDGLQTEQAALLNVNDDIDHIVVATLNLRCRVDDWAQRKNLVIAALARIDPDLVAFQEDCAEGEGPTQSEEIRNELATYTQRGYELRRAVTHTAWGLYAEGVSLLSAHGLTATRIMDLPSDGGFMRKAVVVDAVIDNQPLRFYATHFEVGDDKAALRSQQAQAILNDVPSDRLCLLAGDLNATPDQQAILNLGATMADLWAVARPHDPGHTIPASFPTSRIDYIFRSYYGSAELLGVRLLDEHVGQLWLSDHLGVAAALSW